MQGHQVGLAGLQVGNLVQVGILAADDRARRVLARTRRPHVAVGRVIEDRLGGRAAQHLDGATGAGVVVDRAALAVLPAKHEHVVPRSRTDEVARVTALREA